LIRGSEARKLPQEQYLRESHNHEAKQHEKAYELLAEVSAVRECHGAAEYDSQSADPD